MTQDWFHVLTTFKGYNIMYYAYVKVWHMEQLIPKNFAFAKINFNEWVV